MQLIEKMRLDKWLWAARFFKTRSLAVVAINGGKIHLNGQKAKPGKEIQAGCCLRIRKDVFEWNITVVALCKQRRPASEATQLYSEDADSQIARQEIANNRKTDATLYATDRPNKKERRQIHRFTGKHE